MNKKNDVVRQWTSETVPLFAEIWQWLSVTNYAIDSGDHSPEAELVEKRCFCLVLDGEHTLFEALHTLDIGADMPTLRPRDLYDAWTESTRQVEARPR